MTVIVKDCSTTITDVLDSQACQYYTRMNEDKGTYPLNSFQPEKDLVDFAKEIGYVKKKRRFTFHETTLMVSLDTDQRLGLYDQKCSVYRELYFTPPRWIDLKNIKLVELIRKKGLSLESALKELNGEVRDCGCFFLANDRTSLVTYSGPAIILPNIVFSSKRPFSPLEGEIKKHGYPGMSRSRAQEALAKNKPVKTKR